MTIGSYDVGTATVAQNGMVVTFGGAAALDTVREADLFMGIIPIVAVDKANRTVTLKAPGWIFPAFNASAYYINYLPPAVMLDSDVRTLMAALSTGDVFDTTGVTIPSAATCDIGAVASSRVTVQGTTAITSFGAKTGKLRIVTFTGALTLTHNAGSLSLLGGKNRVTAAGDRGTYVSDGSGNWLEVGYYRAATDAGDMATKSGVETLSNKMVLGPLVVLGQDVTKQVSVSVSATGVPFLDATGMGMSWGSGSGSLVARWGARTTGAFGIRDDVNGLVYGLRATSNAVTDPVVGYPVIGFFGFYSGMGLGGASNYNANTNPVFGVNSADQLTGTNYGLGHNLLNIQNNGYVSTYNTVLDDGTGNMKPGTDNAKSQGTAANRWSVIYSGTPSINTSDEREKQWLGALSAAQIAAGMEIIAEIGGFKFLDAIALKGEAEARLHFGVRAQRIRDVWVSHCGETAPLPAFLCFDEWPETPAVPEQRVPQIDANGNPVCDENDNQLVDVIPARPAIPGGDRWGIRSDELAMFLFAVMDARVSALEAVLAS